MTNYASGVVGPAFDSWTVTRESATGASTIPDINNTLPLDTVIQNSPAKPAITATMDLHPAGQIVYIIKAKINENAIGTFTNTASLNGLKSSVTSSSGTPKVGHTKEVYEETGTTIISTFKPGQNIVYKIKLTNTGSGISALKSYKDIINNIVGEIAETPGSGPIPTGPVFKTYSVDEPIITGGGITTVGTMNQNIDLPKVIIAPGGSIEFIIRGTLRDDLIGKFINTSNYDGNIQTKELKPESTTIQVTKTLTKLKDVTFKSGDTYNPGDSVEYTVVIENKGESFFNNLRVGDNIDAIVTSLTGDANGKALKDIVISAAVVTNTVSKPVLTDIKPVLGNTLTNLQVEVDLAPKDKIVYTITGKIVESAIGTIPANIAVV
ncbi:MAG: hypothetical protein ACRDAQ_03595, partial [Cetobacterium sp.]